MADAAQAVGYKQHSLVQALKKPHVKAFRADVKRAWMASETEKAWVIVAGLANDATSEDVRLKAARTILEAAGELKPAAANAGAPRTLIQIVAKNASVKAGVDFADRGDGVVEVDQADACLTIEGARFEG